MRICFLDGRAFTLFSRVFTLISRENTLIFLALKMHQVQKMPKVVQLRSCGEKTAQKSRNLANENFICAFFEDTGII